MLSAFKRGRKQKRNFSLGGKGGSREKGIKTQAQFKETVISAVKNFKDKNTERFSFRRACRKFREKGGEKTKETRGRNRMMAAVKFQSAQIVSCFKYPASFWRENF